MATTIKLRRDTTLNWETINPVLQQGEMGYELDTNLIKIGNNVDTWLVLPYLQTSVTSIAAHPISELNDVTITGSPSAIPDGNVLTWDSGTDQWINAEAVAGASAIGDLTDVVLTGSPALATDDVLVFDGVNWVNAPASAGITSHFDLTDIGTTSHADIDSHVGAISPHNNWMTCNSGADFTLPPTASLEGIAIGTSAVCSSYSIAIGTDAITSGNWNIAIGDYANAAINKASIAIGKSAKTLGENSIAIGTGAFVSSPTYPNSIAIGNGVTSAAANIVSIGTSNTTKSVLSSGGQLSLFGTTAQFIQPSYTTAGLPIGYTGGTVFDTTTGTLKVYTGASWDEIGGGVEVNDLTASVTWANVPDANITETSVTQHEAALSITESQISDLGTEIATKTELSSNTGDIITNYGYF